MGHPVVAVNAAEFADPDEGTTATVERLVMAASYWKVSESALRSLVCFTALACASDKVIAMTVPACDLDELEGRKLIRQSEPSKVVLL